MRGIDGTNFGDIVYYTCLQPLHTPHNSLARALARINIAHRFLRLGLLGTGRNA